MVRSGEHAMLESDRPTEAPPSGEGLFSTLPKAEAPASTNLHDFPILSQIHQEIGTIASVVNQINHISNFIQERAPSLPQTQADPHETASQQSAPAQAPEQAAPPPSAQPAATVAVPAQQTPHAEPALAAPPSEQEPLPHPATEQVSEEIINAICDRLYTFVEGVTASVQAYQPFTVDQAFYLVAEVVATPTATDVMNRRAIYTRESSDADQGLSTAVVLNSVNVCIYEIKIGEGLQFDREQLIDLGVSGLVHDVGMVKLPVKFFTKGQLEQSDAERLHYCRIDGSPPNQTPLLSNQIFLASGT
jgi:hypothetical protein